MRRSFPTGMVGLGPPSTSLRAECRVPQLPVTLLSVLCLGCIQIQAVGPILSAVGSLAHIAPKITGHLLRTTQCIQVRCPNPTSLISETLGSTSQLWPDPNKGQPVQLGDQRSGAFLTLPALQRSRHTPTSGEHVSRVTAVTSGVRVQENRDRHRLRGYGQNKTEFRVAPTYPVPLVCGKTERRLEDLAPVTRTVNFSRGCHRL
jgi:hypothetical protein